MTEMTQSSWLAVPGGDEPEVSMDKRKILLNLIISALFCMPSAAVAQRGSQQLSGEQRVLQAMHSIQSQELFEYVRELASEKYWGRLTGTSGYNEAADWVISHFEEWGLSPVGDNGTYLQAFPNPYTLVFEECSLSLHIPTGEEMLQKNYLYEEEFIPGSTSGSGEVTAEVVYVGYGISAPDLGFDEYEGVDVEGKIVLMEPEVPVGTGSASEFMKWRPYSFHQYKLENAVAHGARGMLYDYHITNPNNSYSEGFVYSAISRSVVDDIFTGTGKVHRNVLREIRDTLKPRSFATGKVVTIKNTTEHHPEGVAFNVVGAIIGSDPDLKDEVIIVGGHLDHLGRCYEIMPGANDNASGVAVIMGLAEALTRSSIELRRTVLFCCFGAEEQGVVGSRFYTENPIFPLENTLCLINLDSVGAGDRLRGGSGENYPGLWHFIQKANEEYIHRIVAAGSSSNLARPRLDAAWFRWAGVPSLSFGASGTPSYYHVTRDNIDTITPEIMEDLAQMLFMAILDMDGHDKLDFRK